MNATKQQSENSNAVHSAVPVISPLANDKTYGERVYHGVFDWGLNYWTNLLSSAGFSQWAEHGTRSVSWLGDKSPREWQAKVSKSIAKKDAFMNGKIPFTNIDNPITFMKGFKHKVYAERDAQLEKITQYLEKPHRSAMFGGSAEKKAEFLEAMAERLTSKAEFQIGERAMARARSLILLIPGFAVVIPTVWLGAKVKPWFVQTMNKMHYGAEAMDDPSMIARQQAIEAEIRPTLLGTVVARFGTVIAAQTAAQLVGSKNNFVNKLGKKNPALANFGVDPVTEKVGATLGGAMPEGVRQRFDKYATGKGLEASEHQLRKNLIDTKMIGRYDLGMTEAQRNTAKANLGNYNTGAQDLGRFVVADTFYTAVTLFTIHPMIKLLRMIPGMSYKPKMPKDAAYFTNGTNVTVPTPIKVPANEFGLLADREPAATSATQQTDTPNLSINQASTQGTLQQREQQIA